MKSNLDESRDSVVSDEAGLRQCYAPPIERARLKTLRKLDRHCRRFIELSPFLCLGSEGPDGVDVSPRGDQPGFVQVLDDQTLAVPDWPGNNRLDSMTNIVARPRVGMLFLIPGVDESLRVNGTAQITTSPEMLSRWEVNGKHPRSVLLVTVAEAYLHCGKALIRSRLWKDDYRVDRAELPSYGRMLKDQVDIADTAEQIEASVEEGYRERLY
jgi:PPOX class probable FMN-dependent enzyme